MVKPRIIPCLLIKDGSLVKSKNFENYTYLGDPLNAIRIFNGYEVDELFVMDISATTSNKSPDFNLLNSISSECRTPICYGGGINDITTARKIINMGFEKVSISSYGINNYNFLKNLGILIGFQSVVVTLDCKKVNGTYFVYTHNGKNRINENIIDILTNLQNIGIGELVINSIDNDGLMLGLDFTLLELANTIFKGPITVLGGIGSQQHLIETVTRFGNIGIGVGSYFVYNGKFKAVLLSYLDNDEKKQLIDISNKRVFHED